MTALGRTSNSTVARSARTHAIASMVECPLPQSAQGSSVAVVPVWWSPVPVAAEAVAVV